jgi:hypothetical protein
MTPASSRVSGSSTADRAFEKVFLALVAVLPVMQIHARFRGYVIPPADFLFPIATVAFALAVASGRPLRRSVIDAPLAAYACALVLSALWSADRRVSAVKLAGELYLLALAVLTVNYADSFAALRRLTLAWCAGVAICVAAGIAGLAGFAAGARDQTSNIFLDSHGSLPPGSYPRLMASFVNANMMCAYLAGAVALVITAMRLRWIRGAGARCLPIGALIVAAFSLSPGLGGLVLVLGLWLARDFRERSARAAFALSAAAWIVAALFVIATAVPPGGRADSSPRMLTWRSAWRTFVQHPVIGKGVGIEPADVRYTNPSGAIETLTDAHNAWLSVLAQEGIAGLAAFAWLIARAMPRPSDVERQREPERTIEFGAALALGGGFLYQSLTGSFEDARHVWVLIGVAAAVQALRSTTWPHPLRRRVSTETLRASGAAKRRILRDSKRQSSAAIVATSSPTARQDVRPGESIPLAWITRGFTRSRLIRKSANDSVGG